MDRTERAGAAAAARNVGIAIAALLLTAGAGLGPRAADAEGFFDIRAGAAFPEDSDIDASSNLPSVVNVPSRNNTDWEDSPSVGIRGGYWFQDDATRWLGLGLDLSYFRHFEDRSRAPLDVHLLPATPLLMVRIPIEHSDDYPGGRIQPYGAVGPAITLSVARADLSELGVGIDDLTDASLDVGLDVRGGLAVAVGRRVALFVEYRYTDIEPEFEEEVDFAFGPDPDIDLEPDLEAHHLAFGVSFRF